MEQSKAMSKKAKNSGQDTRREQQGNSPENQDEKFPGYPSYPTEDDIYSQETEEADLCDRS